MTSIKTKHRYGWRADLPDQRDKLFAKLIPIPAKLPTSVDLRKICSKIEDQGDLGSCTANAIVGNLETLEIKDNVHFEDLSRLFIYYNERVLENSVSSDTGAELRDGIKALVKWGCCTEKSWAYNIDKFAHKPPQTCYTEAAAHKITSYIRILTLTEMKACLATNFPFVFGFGVYESFESQKVASTGIVPMPQPNEQLLGGHAVCAIGYDDKTGRFLVRNSWGTNWGQNGLFTIPYEYLTNKDLSDDFWCIKRESGY